MSSEHSATAAASMWAPLQTHWVVPHRGVAYVVFAKPSDWKVAQQLNVRIGLVAMEYCCSGPDFAYAILREQDLQKFLDEWQKLKDQPDLYKQLFLH